MFFQEFFSFYSNDVIHTVVVLFFHCFFNIFHTVADIPLLLQSSEVHFEIANNTVFAADNYTTSKSHQLTLLSALMLAGIIIMWIALFMVYLRKLYSLESSNKTLYDITTKDPLTGAYNFETFKKKAQKLLTQTTKKYSLSYVDLDRKSVV